LNAAERTDSFCPDWHQAGAAIAVPRAREMTVRRIVADSGISFRAAMRTTHSCGPCFVTTGAPRVGSQHIPRRGCSAHVIASLESSSDGREATDAFGRPRERATRLCIAVHIGLVKSIA
jgi:hypothetical protein